MDNVQINEGTSGKYVATKEVSSGVHIGKTIPVDITGTAIGFATETTVGSINTKVGEVQEFPTQYTLLDRIKSLLTGIILASGSNVIGKVGIDQTTPGTTNKVAIGTDGEVVIRAGTAEIGNVKNSGTFAVQSTLSSVGTKVQGKVDSSDTTTARAVVAAIASNYVYITSFIISVAVAGNYWLEDGDGTQITPKFYFPANGGVSWTCEGTTPYKTNTVNKAINVKGSISGSVGVMLTGYQSTT